MPRKRQALAKTPTRTGGYTSTFTELPDAQQKEEALAGLQMKRTLDQAAAAWYHETTSNASK